MANNQDQSDQLASPAKDLSAPTPHLNRPVNFGGGGHSLILTSRMFESMRNPNFRRLWIAMMGQMGSMNMQMVARAWYMYELTGSATLLGLTGLANGLPMLTLSLFGGVIADQVQKKWDENFINEIMVVAGDEWHGGNLSYHLKDRPVWDNIFENTKISSLKNNEDGFILIGDSKTLLKICKGIFAEIKTNGVCMIGKKK